MGQGDVKGEGEGRGGFPRSIIGVICQAQITR